MTPDCDITKKLRHGAEEVDLTAVEITRQYLSGHALCELAISFAKQEEYFSAALDIAKEIEEPFHRAAALGYVLVVGIERDKLDLTAVHQEFSRIDDLYAPWIGGHLAVTYAGKGNFAVANQYVNECCTGFAAAEAHYRIALLLNERKDLAGAKTALERAQDAANSEQILSYRDEALENISLAEAQILSAEKALGTISRISNKETRTRAFENLAQYVNSIENRST